MKDIYGENYEILLKHKIKPEKVYPIWIGSFSIRKDVNFLS